ncbi:MAG TPA: energy transducer TonB [Candidatus Aquilonibacter sp.]
MVVSVAAMKTVPLRRMLLGIILALVALGARSAQAQTWQWQVVVHPPGAAPVNARSRVVLSHTDVTMSYSAQIQQRQVTIASCRAALGDIAKAEAVQQGQRAFLLLHLKPQTPAACDSGRQTVAMVPVADDAVATRVAAAINHACCTPTLAAARPAPSTAPSSAPSPTAAPTASSSPPPKTSSRLTDWVESQGAFAFVRVRNRFSEPVAITAGEVGDCRNVAYGCGPFPSGGFTLQPGSAMTIATVMWGDRGNGSAFTYRYTGERGQTRITGAGSSGKLPTGWRPRMSAQEIRIAEVAAIAGLRDRSAPGETVPSAQTASSAPTPTPVPAFVAAQLTRRGSSRLGIGQTGEAQVRVSLGANGVPQNASIVSVSNRQLVTAALETAISSTYSPAMRNGRAIPGSYVATFKFDGQDPATSSIPVWRRDPSPAPSSTP